MYACPARFLCFLQLSDQAYVFSSVMCRFIPPLTFWHHMIQMKLFMHKSVDCAIVWLSSGKTIISILHVDLCWMTDVCIVLVVHLCS